MTKTLISRSDKAGDDSFTYPKILAINFQNEDSSSSASISFQGFDSPSGMKEPDLHKDSISFMSMAKGSGCAALVRTVSIFRSISSFRSLGSTHFFNRSNRS